jgi:hypothetical protein
VSCVSIHTLGGYPIRFQCYDSVATRWYGLSDRKAREGVIA